MKVLFVTRPHLGLSKGGLHIQICRTAEMLRELGVEVVQYDPWLNQIPDVDLCHFFSLSESMIHYFTAASRQLKPIIYSPVLGNSHVPTWKFKSYVKASVMVRGFLIPYKIIKSMFDLSAKIIALNEFEKQRISTIFNQNLEKISVIPNGVNNKFASAKPDLFYEKYGIKDFVLNVGSIDPNKNQLTLIKAMRGLPYKLVIIGSPIMGHLDYEAKCKRQAGDNVLFTAQLSYDDPLLASAYAAAKLFVLPSISEVQPLVFAEAAQTGCMIATTKNVCPFPGLEFCTHQFCPKSVKGLKNMIINLMANEIDSFAIREKARQLSTWQDISDDIVGIYKQLLKNAN